MSSKSRLEDYSSEQMLEEAVKNNNVKRSFLNIKPKTDLFISNKMISFNCIEDNVLYPSVIKQPNKRTKKSDKKYCSTPGCNGLGNRNPKKKTHSVAKNCPNLIAEQVYSLFFFQLN